MDGREFIKNPGGCLIFWIFLVNVWRMCWSFACHNFMLAEPLFLAICLAPRSLQLLILLFGVDIYIFFCVSIKIMPASSARESAGFQGLPCPCIITMVTQLGWKMGTTPGKNTTDSHSSYLWFCGFSRVTTSSFVLCFWPISIVLKSLFCFQVILPSGESVCWSTYSLILPYPNSFLPS